LIKEESEIEEEDLVNNRFENLSLNKEVDTRVNNSPCIVSTAIEEYFDSESRNKKLAFRNKIAELEKEKYFEDNKGEYSELERKVFVKYADLHEVMDITLIKLVRNFQVLENLR
jgi:hypothetical protein